MRYKVYILTSLFFSTLCTAVGDIVVVHGSTSAGKSSFCKAFLKHADDWEYINEDYLAFIHLRNSLSKAFRKQFLTITAAIEEKNIYHAIERNQIIFKDSISRKQKKCALKAIRHIADRYSGSNSMRRRMYAAVNAIRHIADRWHSGSNSIRRRTYAAVKDAVIEKAKHKIAQGINVIIDFPNFEQKKNELQQLGCNLYTVLLYCPFECIIERIQQRNIKALRIQDLSEHRLYRYSLNSFHQLYEVCQEGEEPIDSLDKHRLDTSFDQISKELAMPVPYSMIPGLSFFTRELNIQELNMVKQNYYELFGLNQHDLVYIKPKLSYDFIIDTADSSPGEAILPLLKMLKN